MINRVWIYTQQKLVKIERSLKNPGKHQVHALNFFFKSI